MSDKKERVVTVDDHPQFPERLAQLINHELNMEICGEAENAQQGIQLVRNNAPDLAIVDITLKGSSGLELIKNIRGLSIGIPILVLTVKKRSTQSALFGRAQRAISQSIRRLTKSYKPSGACWPVRFIFRKG